MTSKDVEEIKKEDYFIYSGKESYYGRLCENYGKECDKCKWQDTYRCRDGSVRG